MSEPPQSELNLPDQAFVRRVVKTNLVGFLAFLGIFFLLLLSSIFVISSRLECEFSQLQSKLEENCPESSQFQVRQIITQRKVSTAKHLKTLKFIVIVCCVFALGIIALMSWLLTRMLKRYFTGYRNLLTDSQHQVEEMTTILVTQTKMADMGQMLDIIAHQLKTPLQEIFSSVEMMSLQLKKFPEAKELNQHLIKAIDANVLYMTDTIDDLRSFLRPDKSIGVNDLIKIIDKAIRIVAPKLKRNDINVKKDYENVNTLIKSSSSELQQVIIALLVNGIDAMVAEKVKNPFFHLRISKNDEWIVLEIEDNGGGIPDHVIDKIFDPYFTTKTEGGTGIGLYMSRMIIEEGMRGEMTVRNSDCGACFVIKLREYVEDSRVTDKQDANKQI